jgi:cob(I)alamin adenosyltransferase
LNFTGVIQSYDYEIIVLDEVNIALYYHLFSTEELIEIGDLVTEMKEIKHYYRQGIMARKGIEC